MTHRELILKTLRKVYLRLFSGQKEPAHYHGKKILSGRPASELLGRKISEPGPLMVSRFGSVELNILQIYLQNRRSAWAKNREFVFHGIVPAYDETAYRTAQINAGIFPPSTEILNIFSETVIKSVKEIDVLGIWNYAAGEADIFRDFCPASELVRLPDLEPYYSDKPWTAALKNKKVLVIHPYEESIRRQYEKREKLFENPDVLPDFELITLPAVQSAAGSETPFRDWPEALNFMCEKINDLDFDIALIGAGAYGMPLAAHVKSLGKKAVHLGGSLQILFGIKGRRWDEIPKISKLYNRHWLRPLDSETPQKSELIENACYW